MECRQKRSNLKKRSDSRDRASDSIAGGAYRVYVVVPEAPDLLRAVHEDEVRALEELDEADEAAEVPQLREAVAQQAGFFLRAGQIGFTRRLFPDARETSLNPSVRKTLVVAKSMLRLGRKNKNTAS